MGMERVRSVSVVERAVVEIERYLVAQFSHGVRELPSERAMALRMGISRPSVREALQRLRERRVLVTVPGRGHFIRSPVGSGSPEAALMLLSVHRHMGSPRAQTLLQELLQFRRLLMATALSLSGAGAAAEKALSRLEAAALFGNGDEVLWAESEVATALGMASDNVALALALQASNHALQAVPNLGEAWKKSAEARASAYRSLVAGATPASGAFRTLEISDQSVLALLKRPSPRPPEPLLPRIEPRVDTRRRQAPAPPPRPPLPAQLETDADWEQLMDATGPLGSLHLNAQRIQAAQRARARTAETPATASALSLPEDFNSS